MAEYRSEGEVIAYTAGADVAAGAVLAINDVVGVAMAPIANGATGTVRIKGEFVVPKLAGVAWEIGDKLDLDVAPALGFTKGLTPATGDVAGCAVAVRAAASADTVGYAVLTPAGTGA